MSLRKSTLIAAASAVAIMAAAPAMAADDNRNKTSAQAEDKSAGQIKADTLVGKNLKNNSGETIGEIESVIIDETGKVAAVIVGVGGFLGMGEREVAVDWNDLQIRKNSDDVQTGMTKADLKGLPAYKYEKPEYRKRAFLDNRYSDRRQNMRDSRAATMDRKADQVDRKAEWVDAKGLRVSKLIGADVVNSQGETIGKVEDLVMIDGRTQLILSVGEFLGMGGHNVALDPDKTNIHQKSDDADDLRVSVAMNKDQLKAMPKFEFDGRKASTNRR
jgi:sporulation protein YlmC with PRC-barrel domain